MGRSARRTLVSAAPLTAVRVQQMLREVDAELFAHPKPTLEMLYRLLERLGPVSRMVGFSDISITSPLTGRGVLLSQLVYNIEARIEVAEAVEHMLRTG